MTVCLYGSGPRPGAPSGFWLTLQGVLAFLPSALNGWLAWSPDWLSGAYVSTADLCAAPQPVVGAFPAADYLACQLSPLSQYGGSCAVVQSWFNTFVRSLLWANQCQCDAAPGTICPPPSVVTNDAINPTNSNLVMGAYAAAPSSTGGTWSFAPHNFSGSIDLKLYVNEGPNADGSASTTLVSADHVGSGGATITYSRTPAAGKYLSTWIFSYPGARTGQIDWTLTQTGCTANAPTYLPAPTTPSQPSGVVSLPSSSCSTTADLCAELLRVEQYIAELTATVGYLTRQLAPYSYILGAPTSGLSGSGYVSVTECLGVLVTLTTIPSTKGTQSGTPTRYFDVGRINWGDVNGYHAHHPIHSSPELILGIPDTATRIGYTFPTGVVATITPVKRA